MRRSRNALSNPVSRAVAQNNVRRLLLTAKMKVYTFSVGEDVSEFMSGVMRSVALVAMAAERQWFDDMPAEVARDMSVVRGGMSAITQTLYRWDIDQAVAIEQALIRVERLNGLLKAEHVLAALQDIARIDRQYAAATTP